MGQKDHRPEILKWQRRLIATENSYRVTLECTLGLKLCMYLLILRLIKLMWYAGVCECVCTYVVVHVNAAFLHDCVCLLWDLKCVLFDYY